jgi:hypothetical protein
VHALVVTFNVKTRHKCVPFRHDLNRSNRALNAALTCDMSATPIEVVRELNF